jgi:hypothetical protein
VAHRGWTVAAVYHDLSDEHREHMKSRGIDPADAAPPPDRNGPVPARAGKPAPAWQQLGAQAAAGLPARTTAWDPARSQHSGMGPELLLAFPPGQQLGAQAAVRGRLRGALAEVNPCVGLGA